MRTKKRISVFILCLAALYGCNKDDVIVDEIIKIEFEQSNVSLSGEENSVTVSVKSNSYYSFYGISSVKVTDEEGEQIYYNDVGEGSKDEITQEWFWDVKWCRIVRKNPKEWEVSLLENTSGQSRSLTISVQAGPSYGGVTIRQKSR
ncbi:MAG: hypothetical protein LBB84_09460 [Tannerellaceae bacterium]|jgi:hypothetical protein|nr:hypothetical protein [Tannerellaceae bacterium]